MRLMAVVGNLTNEGQSVLAGQGAIPVKYQMDRASQMTKVHITVQDEDAKDNKKGTNLGSTAGFFWKKMESGGERRGRTAPTTNEHDLQTCLLHESLPYLCDDDDDNDNDEQSH